MISFKFLTFFKGATRNGGKNFTFNIDTKQEVVVNPFFCDFFFSFFAVLRFSHLSDDELN